MLTDDNRLLLTPGGNKVTVDVNEVLVSELLLLLLLLVLVVWVE